MKSPPFKYCRPTSVDEALALLSRFGDDARLLAGGQSLLPTLNMRLSAPSVLIDMRELAQLRGIAETPGGLRIGALTRHVEVERSALVAALAPLLAQAMPLVAHPPVREMGTYGGSVVLADPAAEAPAATLAHEAVLLARSQTGERRIAADDFFLGLYSTALAPGEILTGAEFPRPLAGQRFIFREIARRSGDFATAGIALRARIEAGRVADCRVVAFGVADRPTLLRSAAQALVGGALQSADIDAALQAVEADVQTFSDLHYSEAAKLHLLRVLLKRVLHELAAGSQP